MVLGKTDTGKSTLIRRLSEDVPVTIIDSDIGQSDIGPPSVVSRGRLIDGISVMEDGYFVGSVTPAGHLLQLIAGVSRMTARAGDGPVVINTCGLITGDMGRALKTEKINSVKPDMLVLIDQDNDLSYIDAFTGSGVEVHRFSPAPGVRVKSKSERLYLRAKAFREHFSNALESSVTLDNVYIERSLLNNGERIDPAMLPDDLRRHVVHVEMAGGEAIVIFERAISDLDRIAASVGADLIQAFVTDDFLDLVTGIYDDSGRFQGLGIIKSIDFRKGRINLYSPAQQFSVLQPGSIKLNHNYYPISGRFTPVTYRL
ncbi:MAG TPA: Clp1/GlmU family protein [Methanocella sp.]|nr:Clp1/GlmU family protein [Methanocella sp.]